MKPKPVPPKGKQPKQADKPADKTRDMNPKPTGPGYKTR